MGASAVRYLAIDNVERLRSGFVEANLKLDRPRRRTEENAPPLNVVIAVGRSARFGRVDTAV